MSRKERREKTKYEALGSDYEPERALGYDYEFEEKGGTGI